MHRVESKLNKSTDQSKYSAIFEKAPIAMAILDASGMVEESNHSLQKMLGYTEEEFRTINFVDVTHPDDVAIDVELFEMLISEKISEYNIEKRYFHKDGSLVWGDLSVCVLRNEFGEIQNVIGMVKDITEDKKHVRQIEKLNEDLQLQLKKNENAHKVAEFGYYETDLIANCWKGSKEFYEIFGFDAADAPFTQEEFQAIVHPDDFDDVMREFGAAIQNKRPFNAEYRCIHKQTGETIHVESRAIIEYEKDVPVSVFGIKYVITEHKELQEELERANSRLHDFTYTVAHDLKEPIRSVSSILSLIDSQVPEDFSDQTRKYMDMAICHSLMLSKMVSSLLDFARLERSANEVKEVSLIESIDKVKGRLNGLLSETRARVIYEGEDVQLEVYEEQFYSILQNLIGNAIRYCDEDDPTVWVTLEEDQSMYYVNVKDNGPGIAPKYQESIFKIFNRGGRKRTEKRTGVGLYISQQMAELHGGYLNLKKSTSEGSEFEFSILKYLN